MDPLPPYEPPTLPEYHPRPSTTSSQPSTTPDEHTFKSHHLRVVLCSRPRSCRIPVYGYHSTVEGKVWVNKNFTHVVTVTATLKGIVSLITTDSGRVAATIAGASHKTILLQNLVLFNSGADKSVCLAGGEEFSFSLPFPRYVSRGESPLPPSYTVCHPGAYCNISYSLRVDVVRKGFHRHERVSVPIFYLPMSRPSLSPLLHLAPQYTSENLPYNDRVIVVDLVASHSAKDITDPLHASCIQLSIPTPKCFAAGEWVPLAVTISCTKVPALPRLLTSSCVTVRLVKRSQIWSGSNWNLQEVVLSSAELQRYNDPVEGTCMSYWLLQMGKPQQQASWQLPGAIVVKYIIRVHIKPPCNIAQKLPPLLHDEFIRITSDPWIDPLIAEETREDPALGLANLPSDVGAQNTRLWPTY